jgi:hypothetical protein
VTDRGIEESDYANSEKQKNQVRRVHACCHSGQAQRSRRIPVAQPDLSATALLAFIGMVRTMPSSNVASTVQRSPFNVLT